MDLREKLRSDWTRRALADARWWSCQTPEVDRSEADRLAEVDLEVLLRGLTLDRQKAVLDLGCGTGRLSGRIADRCDAVVGVDVSPSMLEAAKTYHPERPSLRYVATDGVRLPFPRASFDIVVAFAVLQHLDASLVQAVLANVRRVVKPTGVLRIQGWLGEVVDSPPASDTLRIRTWAESELREWIRLAGFEITEVIDMPYPEAEEHRRPVVISARPVGLAEYSPSLPDVPELSSATEIAQEWGLLLHLVQKYASKGRFRRALHAIRAGNRLLPAQAVGWWVEARLLFARGEKTEALQALEQLDRMPERSEDRAVLQAAMALRRELESPDKTPERAGGAG